MLTNSPRFLSLLLALTLVACAGAPVETAPAEQQAALQPAPTAGCAWSYTPMWLADFGKDGCSVVQACPGTVLAPLSAGAAGRCDLPSFGDVDATYCDDAPTHQIHALTDLVVWQPAGETRPLQYSTRPCGI